MTSLSDIAAQQGYRQSETEGDGNIPGGPMRRVRRPHEDEPYCHTHEPDDPGMHDLASASDTRRDVRSRRSETESHDHGDDEMRYVGHYASFNIRLRNTLSYQ